MDDTQVSETLYEIFNDFFELDRSEFGPDLTADQVDGWDSLNHIRLMLNIQQNFGVKFSSGEISDLKNVGQLASLIAAKT
ncbi:acyl carrier protein [Sulfitobacter sabulilitoris]|uniref:Acyl carrier protein n=1 Tax=Sulfitobacter sabulilitoris TaxID=2562655 RepID=A0A5S3PBH5_9RHOB|nr:acyl carrier protein [Sulfitobacter sabulilitoris]TMM51040.1 acyl carrier protein [Sulfitobacter sabulilitoris]